MFNFTIIVGNQSPVMQLGVSKIATPKTNKKRRDKADAALLTPTPITNSTPIHQAIVSKGLHFS